VTENRSI